MTRGRTLALVVVGFVCLAIGALLHWRSNVVRQAAERARYAAVNAVDVAPVPLPRAPSVESIAADALPSAALWRERARAVVRAKNAGKFGAEVARLTDLPPDEAWPALRDRALSGDLASAVAAMMITETCSHRPPPQDGYASGTRPNVSASMHPSLPAHWKAFIEGIETLEREHLHATMEHCDGVGGVIDFALLMFDRFFQPDDPDVQVAFASQEEDSKAIADLRQITQRTPSADAQRALGERLMRAQDPALQAEGRGLLEHLAATDADALIDLASCTGPTTSRSPSGLTIFGSNACHAFSDDPDALATWTERAAGLGDYSALDREIANLRDANRLADAWAWSLYRLDLAVRGCFEWGNPSFNLISVAADEEEALKRRIDAKQHNAGEAIANEIAGRWEARATERLACAD